MRRPISDIKILEKKPEGFSAQVEIAACYLELDNQFLLLQRTERKSEGGLWGVPAGKLEKGETAQEAAARELLEETGISIGSSHLIQSLGSLYIRKPEIDYVYHMFKVHIDHFPSVQLSHEHQNYEWASLDNIERMPLMAGAKLALEYYQKMKSKRGL